MYANSNRIAVVDFSTQCGHNGAYEWVSRFYYVGGSFLVGLIDQTYSHICEHFGCCAVWQEPTLPSQESVHTGVTQKASTIG